MFGVDAGIIYSLFYSPPACLRAYYITNQACDLQLLSRLTWNGKQRLARPSLHLSLRQSSPLEQVAEVEGRARGRSDAGIALQGLITQVYS